MGGSVIMDINFIEIPPITLSWSDWFDWSRFELDARSDPQGLKLPDTPGVYEAKLKDSEERLTIGKASNLRMRVKQGLVKDKVPHSSGDDIREKEDTSNVVIRWAVTDRPAAVEEELHRQHVAEFSKLPKYTDRT
jgi:hypothetical protein